MSSDSPSTCQCWKETYLGLYRQTNHMIFWLICNLEMWEYVQMILHVRILQHSFIRIHYKDSQPSMAVFIEPWVRHAKINYPQLLLYIFASTHEVEAIWFYWFWLGPECVNLVLHRQTNHLIFDWSAILKGENKFKQFYMRELFKTVLSVFIIKIHNYLWKFS